MAADVRGFHLSHNLFVCKQSCLLADFPDLCLLKLDNDSSNDTYACHDHRARQDEPAWPDKLQHCHAARVGIDNIITVVFSHWLRTGLGTALAISSLHWWHGGTGLFSDCQRYACIPHLQALLTIVLFTEPKGLGDRCLQQEERAQRLWSWRGFRKTRSGNRSLEQRCDER